MSSWPVWKRIVGALGALLVLLIVGLTPKVIGAAREWDTYHQTPALQIGYEVTGGMTTRCIWINTIFPPAHHDWLGRIWQDEFLMWDDVEIVERWNGTWEHGMSGPMRVGDEICDVPKYHVWVYTPEDKVFLTMG